jgi:hypothetical protein
MAVPPRGCGKYAPRALQILGQGSQQRGAALLLDAFAVETVDQPSFHALISAVHSSNRTPGKDGAASLKMLQPLRSRALPFRSQLRDRNCDSTPNQGTLCVSRFEQALPPFRSAKLGSFAVLADQQLGGAVDILLWGHLSVAPRICGPHEIAQHRP